jgi:hypothetical protein
MANDGDRREFLSGQLQIDLDHVATLKIVLNQRSQAAFTDVKADSVCGMHATRHQHANSDRNAEDRAGIPARAPLR